MSKDPSGKAREVKVVLLGDTSVGKSTLVVQYVSGNYNQALEPTVGASFFTKTITVEQQNIKFQIWDTAGQERYRGLAPMYYRNSAAAVVVYDITKKKSFDALQKWVTELRSLGPSDIVIAVVGNKADDAQKREIPESTGKTYADSVKGIFFETSAKTGLNVNKLFDEIARKLPPESSQAKKPGLSLGDEGEGKAAQQAPPKSKSFC